MPDFTPQVVTLTGLVCEQLVLEGTKSEHLGVVLKSPAGEYILQRQGGNPFHDPELQQFVGKRIQATGLLLESGILRVQECRVME